MARHLDSLGFTVFAGCLDTASFVMVDYVDHGNDDGGCDIVTLAVVSIIYEGIEGAQQRR